MSAAETYYIHWHERCHWESESWSILVPLKGNKRWLPKLGAVAEESKRWPARNEWGPNAASRFTVSVVTQAVADAIMRRPGAGYRGNVMLDARLSLPRKVNSALYYKGALERMVRAEEATP